jgi:mannose-6-phosphate isomerase-like protein (cupin superfamily)
MRCTPSPSGTGTITFGPETHPLRPGSVAVISSGVLHSLEASAREELEFVMFGTPPMAMDDERAKPEGIGQLGPSGFTPTQATPR